MTSLLASPKSRPQYRNIHVSQIVGYRLPAAGIVSILHRVSGVLLFFGLPFLLWMFDLSLTSEVSYYRLAAFASHWLGKLMLVGFVWAFVHHLVAGFRYLALDLHLGIDKETANKSAFAIHFVSIPVALLAALKLFGAF